MEPTDKPVTAWRATKPGAGNTPPRPSHSPVVAHPPSGEKAADTRKEEYFWDGELILSLKHARGLIAADVSGTSDPYCRVFLKSETHNVAFIDGYKTKIQWKTLNPDWNDVGCTRFSH